MALGAALKLTVSKGLHQVSYHKRAAFKHGGAVAPPAKGKNNSVLQFTPLLFHTQGSWNQLCARSAY